MWVCSFIAPLNRLVSSVFISKLPYVCLFTLEHEQIIPDLVSSARGIRLTFSKQDCKAPVLRPGSSPQPQPVTGSCRGQGCAYGLRERSEGLQIVVEAPRVMAEHPILLCDHKGVGEVTGG